MPWKKKTDAATPSGKLWRRKLLCLLCKKRSLESLHDVSDPRHDEELDCVEEDDTKPRPQGAGEGMYPPWFNCYILDVLSPARPAFAAQNVVEAVRCEYQAFIRQE